ncbi:MAG TPA: HAMP domain-containing sensor histidine kinase, partial [Usitatibacter sp.]|nr:HAMP domain-containing sensor histidine kinase [Usitatibacter sp.]
TELETAGTGTSAEDDRWQLRRDGSRFWASGVMVALLAADGQPVGYGKILRNRTDHKEQLESLRNRVRELESTSDRKDVFLSTLSHELRNPLAPLANAVQIIRLAAPPGAELEYAIRVIERQMELLRRLVDDLLDLSRVNAGKMQLARAPVVLNDVLRQSVDAMRAAFARRQQQLHVTIPETPMVVDGDADRLMQVFVNLLTNAGKYTPQRGRIWLKATADGAEAVVHVEDDGMGIAPEMLPRIFDLFTQVDTARAHSQGGLGIGLALVKDLVALHGGSVQGRSEGPGHGSKFSVRLPLLTAGAAPQASA